VRKQEKVINDGDNKSPGEREKSMKLQKTVKFAASDRKRLFGFLSRIGSARFRQIAMLSMANRI
jgi:hypothetical protein